MWQLNCPQSCSTVYSGCKFNTLLYFGHGEWSRSRLIFFCSGFYILFYLSLNNCSASAPRWSRVFGIIVFTLFFFGGGEWVKDLFIINNVPLFYNFLSYLVNYSYKFYLTWVLNCILVESCAL